MLAVEVDLSVMGRSNGSQTRHKGLDVLCEAMEALQEAATTTTPKNDTQDRRPATAPQQQAHAGHLMCSPSPYPQYPFNSNGGNGNAFVSTPYGFMPYAYPVMLVPQGLPLQSHGGTSATAQSKHSPPDKLVMLRSLRDVASIWKRSLSYRHACLRLRKST